MPFSGFDLMTRIATSARTFEASTAGGATADHHRLRAQGRRRQDDDRVQPRGRPRPARPADRPHRRQPPVRRPAGAAQGPGRRAVDPRPADRPDRRVRPAATSSGATRRGSTSCSRRRASRWPRCSPRATSRRCCRCCAASTASIVIDMSSELNDINLAFLDASDTIVEIVTYDSTTIHNTVAIADTFRAIGYPASKVRYLVNRADSSGGIDPADLERALGRVPEHSVVSDGRLVVQSNNEGVPFVLANPDAEVSQDVDRASPTEILGVRPARGRRRRAARQADVRSAADRGLRLRGRRADRPARDPPPVARRIDDLPRRQRARAVRRPLRRRGPSPSRRNASTRSSSATSRRSWSPATPRRRSRSRAAAPLRPADPRRHPAGRVGGGPRDAQPAGRGHRHAGDDPLARLLRRDQGREPGGRGLRARDAGARAAGRGGRAPRARWPRRPSREALAPLLGERDADGEFDLPAAARRRDRHAAARLHPLPAAAADHRGGRRTAGRDRRLGDGDRLGAGRAARRSTGSRRPATGRDAARRTSS